MSYPEIAVLVSLVMLGIIENMFCVLHHAKIWHRVLVILLPIAFAWHAISWIFTVPLAQVRSVLYNENIMNQLAGSIFVLFVLHLVVAFYSTRVQPASVLFKIINIIPKLPSIAVIIMMYPLGWQLWSANAGSTKQELFLSIVLLYMLLVGLVLWVLNKNKTSYKWLLARPIAVMVQWFLFQLLTQKG
jgi:hypothetical protein